MSKPKTRNTGQCKIPGCDQAAKAMEMCNTHYMQYRRGARSADGNLLRPMKERAQGLTCKVDGCHQNVIARGFCTKHYQQWECDHRTENGQLVDGVVERNTGSRSISVKERQRRGLRAGNCSLCDQPMFHGGTGFCSRHYAQFRRGQINERGEELRGAYRVSSYVGINCMVEGCEEQARSLAMCAFHYQQYRTGIREEDGILIREPKHGGPRGGKDEWKTGDYVKVRCPDHPNADRYGFVLKHRKMMEDKLNRFLDPNEIVHHKRGTAAGNVDDNLELRVRRDHPPGHEIDHRTAAQVLLQKDEEVGLSDVFREFLKGILGPKD